MNTVYCISGLGADERIFTKLEVPGIEFICLQWIRPAKKESIGDYAARMLSQIRGDHPVILGGAFGGMMAIEMARICAGAKVILVSSVKSSNPATQQPFPFPQRKPAFLPGFSKSGHSDRSLRIAPDSRR